MKMVMVSGALVMALALQTTIAGLTLGLTTPVNLVLVVVISAALALGPATGLAAGTIGGLLQDALAGGIIGIGGFSKTLVGFLVGFLGAQFIVAQPLPRFVMFVVGTMVHEVCFQGLHAVVESRPLRLSYPTMLTQAAVNAVIGWAAFVIMERGPQIIQRRRARRSSLRRRHY